LLPERFARVVVGNTILHTFDPALRDVLAWAQYPIDNGERVVLHTAQVTWARHTRQERNLWPGPVVSATTVEPLSAAEVAAYDAPFPEEIYRAGLRQTNDFIPMTPDDPTVLTSKDVWTALRRWNRPFLTVWGAGDVATSGWEKVFQDEIPGAAGQLHQVLDRCNHFMQEDQGPTIAHVIADFIEANP
jgi:haloalkane dehalogenase